MTTLYIHDWRAMRDAARARKMARLRAVPAVDPLEARQHRNSKRVCVNCHHAMCRCCEDWCGSLIPDTDPEADADDVDPCCEASCAWVQLP